MSREERAVEFTNDQYLHLLEQAIREYPDEYCFPVSDAPLVVERMRRAFERGSYNHNSHAIRNRCKQLGIKYTRKAIEEWLIAEDDEPQRDTCHECGELAVGYDEGTPVCANHYRNRMK